MVDFTEEADQEKRIEKLKAELEKLGGEVCIIGTACLVLVRCLGKTQRITPCSSTETTPSLKCFRRSTPPVP